MLSAVQTAFKILAGFVLVKMVALATGPQGVAQLGQFQNLVTVIAILSGGMFSTGVTKLIAEHAEDRDHTYQIIRAVLKASALSFLGVAIVVAVWHDEIATGILKAASLGLFVLFLPFLVFFSVANGLWLAVLNGFRQVRQMVITSIATSLLMILLTLALALPFGEIGAYVAILAPPAIVVCVAAIKACSRGAYSRFKTVGPSVQPTRELGKFAVMGLVSAVALPVAQMFMRDYLADQLSLEKAGIWQGITRISEVYLVFVTTSLSVYFLPKLAQARGRLELSGLLVAVLKLAMPVSLFLGVLIYLCRDLLIELLFTSDFRMMRDLFLWQITGDMVKILSWVFAYVLLVRGTVLMFVVGEVFFNVTYPLLGMYFVPLFGLQGAVVAYGVNYLFYLIYVVIATQVVMKKNEYSNA